MSDKYYSPDISEFHVGFEYESLQEESTDLWSKQSIDDEMDLFNFLTFYLKDHIAGIRVKYLDREDIEECGFEQVPGQPLPRYKMQGGSTKDGYFEVIQSFHNVVKIMQGYEWIRFYGTIKNKSEFKRILKQVGIKS